MPVFFEYLYAFFKEKNSRNGQDRGKQTPAASEGKEWG